jgi:hypothetical protein
MIKDIDSVVAMIPHSVRGDDGGPEKLRRFLLEKPGLGVLSMTGDVESLFSGDRADDDDGTP